MDMITEKQYNYINSVLGKEISEIEQLRQITKQEASNIILRNIVEHRPFLQWYIWNYKGTNYANTTRIYTFEEKTKKYNKGEIKVLPKIFINKRLADEFANQKLKQKAIWQLENQLKVKSLVENWK